jgi:hypothetical protein
MAKITEEIEREKELQAGQHYHRFFLCTGGVSYALLIIVDCSLYGARKGDEV